MTDFPDWSTHLLAAKKALAQAEVAFTAKDWQQACDCLDELEQDLFQLNVYLTNTMSGIGLDNLGGQP